MRNGDEASPSINWACQSLIVKWSKLLDRMVYFDKNLYAYVFKHFPGTGMTNGDEASPSRATFWPVELFW